MKTQSFEAYLMNAYGVISHKVYKTEKELIENTAVVSVPDDQDCFEIDLDDQTSLYVSKVVE